MKDSIIISNMKSICFVIVYMGKFRNDFSFWVKSVEYNSSVDFLLFTDQNTIDVSTPPNLKIVSCTLADIELHAKKELNPKCSITHAYKMCDYKVMYGELFSKYLQNYDFWGHCDTDLIFGDIRSFITDDLLEKYDRIGLEGPFTLYRNTPRVNSIYKLLGDKYISDVFENQSIYAIDEWGLNQNGTSNYWLKNLRESLWCDMVFDNIEPYYYALMSTRVRRFSPGEKRVFFSFVKGKLYRYGLLNNRINKTETLFVHLQKRKITIRTSVESTFSIVPPGQFVPYIEHITPFSIMYKIRGGIIGALYTRLRNKIHKVLRIQQYSNTVLIE